MSNKEFIPNLNPLNMKPINEIQEKGIIKALSDSVKTMFSNDWVFCGWEKYLILAMFFWSLYGVGLFIWKIFT